MPTVRLYMSFRKKKEQNPVHLNIRMLDGRVNREAALGEHSSNTISLPEAHFALHPMSKDGNCSHKTRPSDQVSSVSSRWFLNVLASSSLLCPQAKHCSGKLSGCLLLLFKLLSDFLGLGSTEIPPESRAAAAARNKMRQLACRHSA